MTHLVLTRILIDGAALSAAATILIFASIAWNPRLWLQDLPKDIRDAVPPKTAAERRQSLMWGLPFLVVLLGAPVMSCVWLIRDGGPVPFGTLWLDAFGVALFFNLFDLVVIDWVVVCMITPSFLVVPGTAGLAGYKNYAHHARGFLTGTVASMVIAAIAAGVAALIV